MLKRLRLCGYSFVFASLAQVNAFTITPTELYEAENATLSGLYAIGNDSSVSGGLFVDGESGVNLSWSINNSTARSVILRFKIRVPDGTTTHSMGVYVNGVRTGVVSKSSMVWEEMSIYIATLAAGANTIELRDSEGTAELDVDYLVIKTAAAEAETATVTAGTIKNLGSASGGQYVDLNDGGKVSWSVNAPVGGAANLIYRVKSPTGANRMMGVFVNGVSVGTIFSNSTAWEEQHTIARLTTGLNTVELRDTQNTTELDVDYLDVEGVLESENATSSSSALVTHTAASGGKFMDGSDGANISWTMYDPGGLAKLVFRIKVPSGDRSMGVYVNGSKIGKLNCVSTAWQDHIIAATLLSGSNTIELRDTEATTELDVDFFVRCKPESNRVAWVLVCCRFCNNGTKFLVKGQYVVGHDYKDITQVRDILQKMKDAGIQTIGIDLTNAAQWTGSPTSPFPNTSIIVNNISQICREKGMQWFVMIGSAVSGDWMSYWTARAQTLWDTWAQIPEYRQYGHGDNRPILVMFLTSANWQTRLDAATPEQKAVFARYRICTVQVNELLTNPTESDGWGYRSTCQNASGSVRYTSTNGGLAPASWYMVDKTKWETDLRWVQQAAHYSIYGSWDDTCDNIFWGIADTTATTDLRDLYPSPTGDPYFYYDVIKRVLNRAVVSDVATWNGRGADANWMTPENWSTPPVAGNILAFAGSTQLLNVNNLAQDFLVAGLNFTNTNADGASEVTGNFAITGSRITLGGNITASGIGSMPTPATITDSLGLDMILNGNRFVELNTNHNLTASGIISQDATDRSLIKSGTGNLTLSGQNTYTGGTITTGGIIFAQTSSSALGTGGFTFDGGRRLTIATGLTVANNIVIGATTSEAGRGILESDGNGTATLNGTITINNALAGGGHFGALGAGTLNITGAITSSTNKVVHRHGTVVFSGGGTGYTLFEVASGTTRLGANNGLSTAATVTMGVSGASKLDLAGFNQSLVGITKTVNANTATIGNSSITNDSTLTITGTSTFGGIIQDALSGGTRKVALTVNGGSLTLTGANTYTGPTTVNAGILAVNGTAIADAGKLDIVGGQVSIPAATNEVVGSLVLGGVPQLNGVYGSSTSGAPLANQSDTYFAGTGTITVGPAANNFAAWLTANPPATGFTTDSDNDGIPNGVENVLGTDPNTSSAGLTEISATANSATFKHTLNPTKASDVNYSYEWSSDLVEWTASGVANAAGTIGTIVASAPVSGEVTVTTTRSGTASTKLFTRIKAINP